MNTDHAVRRDLCAACNDAEHENCHVTTQDEVGQWAACGCTCGGGLAAWIEAEP